MMIAMSVIRDTVSSRKNGTTIETSSHSTSVYKSFFSVFNPWTYITRGIKMMMMMMMICNDLMCTGFLKRY